MQHSRKPFLNLHFTSRCAEHCKQIIVLGANEMDAANRSLATMIVEGDGHHRKPAFKAGGRTRGRVLVVDEHALSATGLQLALSGRRWDVEPSSGPTATDVIDHT